MNRIVNTALVLLFTAALSCGSDQVRHEYFHNGLEPYRGDIAAGQWMRDISLEYLDGDTVKTATLQIFFPKNYRRGTTKRTIIALHNTGSDQREWERNSNIAGYANTHGFVVVCPGMGSTIYETSYYPETTRKWDGIPGGKWVGEVLISFIRGRFNLARDRSHTAIMGVSSGARGAILVASKYPEIFGAAAGLSGYYDPLSMTKSSLLTAVYGDHGKFTERWKNDDNIIETAKNLKDTAVFIAHGKDDSHYHYEQSRLLAVKLLMLRNNFIETMKGTAKDDAKSEEIAKSIYPFELHLMRREYHNWPFWNYITPRMMEYFNLKLAKD